MLIIVSLILSSSPSYALLDFIGAQAKKAAETAAYIDAVAELAGEVTPSEELKESAKDIRNRSEALRRESSNLRYLSRSTKAIINGPDWTSKRLDANIHSTTDYVRRIKRLITRIALLGTDGATALNTTETNVALNEVQKNQQTLILQNEDSKLRQIEKEQEEFKQWAEFSDHQRKLRKFEAEHGKP